MSVDKRKLPTLEQLRKGERLLIDAPTMPETTPARQALAAAFDLWGRCENTAALETTAKAARLAEDDPAAKMQAALLRALITFDDDLTACAAAADECFDLAGAHDLPQVQAQSQYVSARAHRFAGQRTGAPELVCEAITICEEALETLRGKTECFDLEAEFIEAYQDIDPHAAATYATTLAETATTNEHKQRAYFLASWAFLAAGDAQRALGAADELAAVARTSLYTAPLDRQREAAEELYSCLEHAATMRRFLPAPIADAEFHTAMRLIDEAETITQSYLIDEDFSATNWQRTTATTRGDLSCRLGRYDEGMAMLADAEAAAIAADCYQEASRINTIMRDYAKLHDKPATVRALAKRTLNYMCHGGECHDDAFWETTQAEAAADLSWSA